MGVEIFGNLRTNKRLEACLEQVRQGFISGSKPVLAHEGTSGAYVLKGPGDDSSALGVFKPIDEEPFAVEHSNDEQCEEGGSPGDISVDDFNDTADTESEYQPSDESDSDVSDCEENGTQFQLQPSSEDDARG